MAVTYAPIATQTTSGTVSSITFSSIPSTYTDLKLIFVGTGAGDISLIFNGDYANSYNSQMMAGLANNGRSNALRTTGLAIYFDNYGSTPNVIPQFVDCDIFSYTNTSFFKNVLYSQNQDQDGTSNSGVAKCNGIWKNTTAISSLTLTGTIYSGAIATLYGIKAA